MNVAVLSESPADEAAIRILIEGILGGETQAAPQPASLRGRGVDSVFSLLPAIVKHLHYRTQADALVVVVDSNHTPVQERPSDRSLPQAKRSRLARLKETVDEVRPELRAMPGREPLKFAVGLAVPAIEAWYLCGLQTGVSEGAWQRGLRDSRDPYNRGELKRHVYGTDRPSLDPETRRAAEEAHRLASCLDVLEDKFPIGFGSLAADVRSW